MATAESVGLGAYPADFELRVFSGLQAGARAPLSADGRWTSLGHDPASDVVLREAPFSQAFLRWADGCWWWRAGEGAPRAIPEGQGIRMGPTALAIGPAQSAWRMPESWWEIAGTPEGEAEPEPSRAPEVPDRREPELDPGSLSEQTEVSGPGRTASRVERPDGVRTSRKPWWGVAGSVSLAVLALSLVLGIGLVASEDEPSKPADDSTARDAPVYSGDPVEQVKRLLARHPLGDGLRVSLGAEGRVEISGVVPDDETLEAMLRPVLGLGVKVSLKVLTIAELESRVQSLDSLLPAEVSASATPEGHIRLLVEADAPHTVEELMAWVRREIPEAAEVTVEFAPAPVAAAPEQSLGGSPLRTASAEGLGVMAVVGGRAAHIVLRDGSHVLPGGRVQGMTLRDIGETELVFQDDRGQVHRMPR